jgi:hypothetical protein
MSDYAFRNSASGNSVVTPKQRSTRKNNIMPDYFKILIPSVIGFMTTVCAAFFSARWAIRRTFEEKWWERKEQAYIEIIDALYDLLRFSSFEVSRYQDSDDQEHPKAKEFSVLYSNAFWKVQKMTDIGSFVISESAAKVLQKLRDRPSLDWGENHPMEIREEESAHYREALNEIRICAKADLKIK